MSRFRSKQPGLRVKAPGGMIESMKLAIGVMGASVNSDENTAANARLIGRLIAQHSLVLITGATTGLPLEAAKGAKEAGGEVIGFSPAINPYEHSRMGLPHLYHDLILHTGLGSKGRNLLNVRASHGLIFVGGSMGALNEFTIAYDEENIMGILEGSGGFCDHLRTWMKSLEKPQNRSIIHYHSDPALLLDAVVASIRERYIEPDVELP